MFRVSYLHPARLLQLVLAIAGIVAVVSLSHVATAENKPATTQPAPDPAGAAAFHLSTPIVKEVAPGWTFVFAETQADPANMMAGIGAAFGPFMAHLEASGTTPFGPVLFTYRQNQPDDTHDDPITLRCGMVSMAGVPDGFDDFETEAVAPLRCVSFYFTGPYTQLPAAWEQAFGRVHADGHTPGPESREVYLYYEAADSPNNVVEIQIGIE